MFPGITAFTIWWRLVPLSNCFNLFILCTYIGVTIFKTSSLVETAAKVRVEGQKAKGAGLKYKLPLDKYSC
jgi:hypothetical protein